MNMDSNGSYESQGTKDQLSTGVGASALAAAMRDVTETGESNQYQGTLQVWGS